MRVRLLSFHAAFATLLAVTSAIHAQSFTSIPALPFETSGPVLRSHAELLKPFTVAGERGVLLGQQDGTFESWLLPVKLLSHLTIEAHVEGYSVPIDVNQQAAEVEVRPDRTTITYSHIAFTIHQIMFSPDEAESGTGPIVLFEFDCLHPTDFIFRFTPNLEWMWPERNEGIPGAEWVAHIPAAGPATEPVTTAEMGGSGFYVLHSDYPDLAGAVTIPGARPGILAPYQEHPHSYPIEMYLHIDPARDHGRLFPLLMAVGMRTEAATAAALGSKLEKLNQNIANGYHSHAEAYKALLSNSVSIHTPDKSLDEAFQWAIVAIEQLKAKLEPHQPTVEAGPSEIALVAGYYASADSARPGFGWFFGRDALYTLYAVNGYGDFSLSRSELEFLIKRQRADGKIMHEYSQTAADIDWQSFPYMYAAADATPLFLLAVEDYVRASGDVAFLRSNRDAVERAWRFETSHAPGPEQGGNGIYDNQQGTGWVESWPLRMPHQEIYLALLDQQASAATAEIENLLESPEKSSEAHQRADKVAKTIEDQFYDAEKSCYAFSRNADGSFDRTGTVYPALAWWSDSAVSGKPAGLAHPDSCLRQFAAHTLDTDWGLRDVSTDEKFYDGMSYHQGSVWPLFTGWAALAEYRANQPLAGYRMLKQNADLTRAQDLGADTELLSGDFYVPFGRSTSHQLWSSAMVITPTLRGLFGISIDARKKTITVDPHLPANWNQASIDNLPLPGGAESLSFERIKPNPANKTKRDLSPSIQIKLTGAHHQPGEWALRSDVSGSEPQKGAAGGSTIRVPTSTIEVYEDSTQSPEPGSRTQMARILRSDTSDKRLTLTVEGLGGTTAMYFVRQPLHVLPHIEVDRGAPDAAAVSFPDASDHSLEAPLNLSIHFPPGEGWKNMTITLTW